MMFQILCNERLLKHTIFIGNGLLENSRIIPPANAKFMNNVRYLVKGQQRYVDIAIESTSEYESR